MLTVIITRRYYTPLLHVIITRHYYTPLLHIFVITVYFIVLIVCVTFLVSMETLTADVQHLRKGLDVAKSERDKQPENYVIHVSFQTFICSFVRLFVSTTAPRLPPALYHKIYIFLVFLNDSRSEFLQSRHAKNPANQ